MNGEETNGNGTLSHLAKPRLSLNRLLFYFITLAALVLIYWKFSELALIKDVFLRSNLFWLVSIIVLQLLTYVFAALNYRDVLRIKDLNVKAKELFPMTFVVLFLNQALPSAGLSGQAFFIQYLKKYGLSLAEGIGRSLLELATLYMAFGSFFIISAALMFRGDVLGRHPEARFFIYGFLFFAIIALAIFVSLQKKSRGRMTRWIINRLHKYFETKNKNGDGNNHIANHAEMILDQFRNTFNIGILKKHKSAFWSAYAWQSAILFLDALTLYFISFAVGFKINFSVALITFTLTSFLSMLSFIPGALGIYEGGMTLILISFGIPHEPALAATMLIRAFTFWLPMPVGWILYKWYAHRRELKHPYEDLPTIKAGKD